MSKGAYIVMDYTVMLLLSKGADLWLVACTIFVHPEPSRATTHVHHALRQRRGPKPVGSLDPSPLAPVLNPAYVPWLLASLALSLLFAGLDLLLQWQLPLICTHTRAHTHRHACKTAHTRRNLDAYTMVRVIWSSWQPDGKVGAQSCIRRSFAPSRACFLTNQSFWKLPRIASIDSGIDIRGPLPRRL